MSSLSKGKRSEDKQNIKDTFFATFDSDAYSGEKHRKKNTQMQDSQLFARLNKCRENLKK